MRHAALGFAQRFVLAALAVLLGGMAGPTFRQALAQQSEATAPVAAAATETPPSDPFRRDSGKAAASVPGNDGELRCLGTISAMAIAVRSPFDGVLQQVNIKEGQSVKKGELLFRFEGRKQEVMMAMARAQLEVVQAEQALAHRRQETGKAMEEEVVRANAALAVAKTELESKEVDLAARSLTSPLDGVVGECELQAGQFMRQGDVLTMVTNLEVLKVEVRVPAQSLARLRVGQKFQARVDAYPQTAFSGEISYIAATVDTATGTVLAKGRLAGAERLRPGMVATVTIATGEPPARPEAPPADR